MEKLTEKEARKVVEALELCDELRHLRKCQQKISNFVMQERYTVEVYHHDEKYFFRSNSKNARTLLLSELTDLEHQIFKLENEIRKAGIIFNSKGEEDDFEDSGAGHGEI